MNFQKLCVWYAVALFTLLINTYCTAEDPSSAQPKPGTIQLVLPKVIHAVVGIESNLYFDNVVLVLNTNNYAFDVSCARGLQQSKRWTYTPKLGEEGSYSFKLEVRDAHNGIVAHARSTVIVHHSTPDKSHTMLLIGDSLTHAGVYSQHLLDLGAMDEHPSISLIGSHGTAPNVHEGYGGWTAQRFATHYTGLAREGHYKERGSPFLYEEGEGNRTLDVKRYLDDINGGTAPTIVTLFLGCNDTFSASDETIEARIDTMLSHMDTLIKAIQEACPEASIGLIASVPAAASQDAFGFNYKNNQTRWQYKRNQHRVVQRMQAHYRDREDEGISLIPAYINIDTEHNYPSGSAPVNARNEQTIIRQTNSVHPNANGYRQIGDSVFCWLMSR